MYSYENRIRAVTLYITLDKRTGRLSVSSAIARDLRERVRSLADTVKVFSSPQYDLTTRLLDKYRKITVGIVVGGDISSKPKQAFRRARLGD